MSQYLITIIMPTYNSERTIEQSLQSIRKQTIDQEQVEILVLDGGSTDATKKIAEKYGATVVINEKRLPEFAKQKGLMLAIGKYGIFIDSDEAFTNMNSLVNRVKCFSQHPDVKNIVSSGQVCAENETGVNRYANFTGDPFSNFVYRYNGYNRIEDISRQYQCSEIENGLFIDFQNSAYLPLFDALGNMFDIEAAREIFQKQGENKSFAANIFSNMVQETKCAIIMCDDYICHRPGLTSKVYLNKLKWRVKNNLFQTEGVGFAERSRKETLLQQRKILFALYVLFVFPVLVTAVRFSIINKDIYFLKHFWYAEYTFWTIVVYIVLKIMHIPVRMEGTYGK